MWKSCPEGHAVPFVDSCDSFACPVCYRAGWMAREAARISAILATEADHRRARGQRWRVVHFAVNPHPSEWAALGDRASTSLRVEHLRAFRLLRARAYRLARKAGIEGGVCVFHRERCADREDPKETDGPHFHVIGFGWLTEDSLKRTGWVVKNLGVRRTPREVTSTALYVLSHAARAERAGGISQEGNSRGLTEVATWFGRTVSMAEVEAEHPSNGPFCPLCGTCYASERWTDLEYIGQGPPPTEACPVNWSVFRAKAPEREVREEWLARRREEADP